MDQGAVAQWANWFIVQAVPFIHDGRYNKRPNV